MWFGSLLSFYNVLIPSVLWLGTIWLCSYFLLTYVSRYVQRVTEVLCDCIRFLISMAMSGTPMPQTHEKWQSLPLVHVPMASACAQHVYLIFLPLAFTAWRPLPYRLLLPRWTKAVSLFSHILQPCFHVYLFETAPPLCSTVYNNLASVCICMHVIAPPPCSAVYSKPASLFICNNPSLFSWVYNNCASIFICNSPSSLFSSMQYPHLHVQLSKINTLSFRGTAASLCESPAYPIPAFLGAHVLFLPPSPHLLS